MGVLSMLGFGAAKDRVMADAPNPWAVKAKVAARTMGGGAAKTKAKKPAAKRRPTKTKK